MTYSRAIVRPPGPNLVNGLAQASLGLPDLELARAQHDAYCAALAGCGLALTYLPVDHNHPDSTFVEDTAVLTPRGAILTRPGAPSRIRETASIAAVLRSLFPTLAEISAPGTVDGGDICDCLAAAGQQATATRTDFLIGVGDRTNVEGARQLTRWLGGLGYRASTIDTTAVRGLLHLKTGLTYLGDGRLAVISELADHPALAHFQKLLVPAEEAYAANCLRLGNSVLVPAGCPRFAATVRQLGLAVLAIEMSEFRKVDGGLSCLSLRF